MKNIIKIITVLAITTSFFSVYSMEESGEPTAIRKPFLKEAQVFHIENLFFLPTMEKMRTLHLHSIERKSPLPNQPSRFLVSHWSGTTPSEESVFLLNAIKLIEHPLTRDRREILNAISQGTEATFNYIVRIDSNSRRLGRIEYSQDPVPLYTSMQNWLESSLFNGEANDRKLKSFKNITLAIIKEKSRNKNEKSGVLATCTDNELEIQIPEVIINFILSLLPECNFDEEERELNKLNRWTQ